MTQDNEIDMVHIDSTIDKMERPEWECDKMIIGLAKSGAREDLKVVLKEDYNLTKSQAVKATQRLLETYTNGKYDDMFILSFGCCFIVLYMFVEFSGNFWFLFVVVCLLFDNGR